MIKPRTVYSIAKRFHKIKNLRREINHEFLREMADSIATTDLMIRKSLNEAGIKGKNARKFSLNILKKAEQGLDPITFLEKEIGLEKLGVFFESHLKHQTLFLNEIQKNINALIEKKLSLNPVTLKKISRNLFYLTLLQKQKAITFHFEKNSLTIPILFEPLQKVSGAFALNALNVFNAKQRKKIIQTGLEFQKALIEFNQKKELLLDAEKFARLNNFVEGKKAELISLFNGNSMQAMKFVDIKEKIVSKILREYYAFYIKHGEITKAN